MSKQTSDQAPQKGPKRFTRFAKAISHAAGTPAMFAVAVGVVLIWALTGPLFDFSDTWQLVINTGTTIITFLMVFLIQNTQNRDSIAMQVKLDELIRVLDKADNALMDEEDKEEEEITVQKERFAKMAKGERDGGIPEVRETMTVKTKKRKNTEPGREAR